MRRPLAILICLAVLLACLPASAAMVQVSPTSLRTGQPALVRVCQVGRAQQGSMSLAGRSWSLWRGRDGCLCGLLPVDLGVRPGTYVLRVQSGGRQLAAARLTIGPHDYGVRRITVDPKFMELTPKQLAWYKSDVAAIKAAYAKTAARRLWRGGFLRPTTSKVVGPFGRRSVINGQERSPHSGVDLRGKKGDPVRAAAAGRVVLVRDTYFGGKLIILDHGQTLFTRYLHLSSAEVQPEQMVRRGQVIGRIGATGRVTGPHLHFDLRQGGARVDPLAWIKMSGRLAGLLGDK